MKILTELVIFIVKKVIEARLVCFDYFFCVTVCLRNVACCQLKISCAFNVLDLNIM